MIAEYYHRYDAHKGTQFVFSDLGTFQPGGGWNVYAEIKRKLVEDYGIPAHEIRFIQECKNEKARKAVIEAMNESGARAVRLDEYARHGRERPAQGGRHPSP